MYPSFTLIPLLTIFLLLTPTKACLHYTATFPFDEDTPFTASIIDNGVQTCWINMSYTKHWRLQVIENWGWRGSDKWKWKPWRFECTDKEWQGKMKGNATDRKYYAEVGVGLRGVTYRAHGERFWFNPDVREDVVGERWVYSKRMWCPVGG